MPLEKSYVENGFEFLEALGQSGLADTESRGCLGKTMLGADRVNGSQMMKFQSLIEISALHHDNISSQQAVAI